MVCCAIFRYNGTRKTDYLQLAVATDDRYDAIHNGLVPPRCLVCVHLLPGVCLADHHCRQRLGYPRQHSPCRTDVPPRRKLFDHIPGGVYHLRDNEYVWLNTAWLRSVSKHFKNELANMRQPRHATSFLACVLHPLLPNLQRRRSHLCNGPILAQELLVKCINCWGMGMSHF